MAEARGQLEPAGVGHGRVAETAAKLCAAAAVYLECAEAQGALTEAERLSLRDEAVAAFVRLARRTGARQAESRPTIVFREILNALFIQKRATLAGRDDQAPAEDPERWGWIVGTDGGWTTRPTADKIGWVDEAEGIAYLLPYATFRAVAAYVRETHVVFPSKPRALGDALEREGLLAFRGDQRRGWGVRVGEQTQRS